MRQIQYETNPDLCTVLTHFSPSVSFFEGSQKLFDALGHTYTHTSEGQAPLQPCLYNRSGQSDPTRMQMNPLNFQATHQPLTKVRLERLTCT